MKNLSHLLLVIILTLTASHSFAQSVPSKMSAYLVMSNRCSRYLTGSRKDDCKKSVERMVDLLDFDVTFLDRDQKSFVFVAFKKNLVNFLSLPESEIYLRALQSELTKFLTGDSRTVVSIWDFTVKYYGSEVRAAEVIASVFQDISTRKLHLAYLDLHQTMGSESFQHNKEYTSLVIDTIHQIIQIDDGEYRPLFYPGDLGKSLNSNLYHFYVPVYLSQKMQREGHSKLFARLGPLMMSLTYEFITAGKGPEYFFSDPEKIEDSWKIQDIYGGYSGGMFGVGAGAMIAPFEKVRAAFQRSTREGVAVLTAF